MKKLSLEYIELILLTALFAGATVYALFLQHRRSVFMLVLTVLMALIAFVARYRHRRAYRTVRGRGRRKVNRY